MTLHICTVQPFLNHSLSVSDISSKGLFTWSGEPRSGGVGFFCFHALEDTKQKKPTPLDRVPPLHVNRVLRSKTFKLRHLSTDPAKSILWEKLDIRILQRRALNVCNSYLRGKKIQVLSLYSRKLHMRHILILLGVLRLLSIRLQKVTTIKWAFFIHIFFHKCDICYVQSPTGFILL